MIPNGHELTLAGALGLLAYGLAVASCALAYLQAKRLGAVSSLVFVSLAVEVFLFLDLIFNWRWNLHDLLASQAMHMNLYAGRREPQTLALVVLLVLLYFGLLSATRLLRTRVSAFLVAFGILSSLILWVTEVISLHAVDHFLYQKLGPFSVVSFFRFATCLVVSVGNLKEAALSGENYLMAPRPKLNPLL
jgi:hypothetical protein